MYLIAIKPKNRETVEFEIAYNGKIVDVVYQQGEVLIENEEIRDFVIEKVLPGDGIKISKERGLRLLSKERLDQYEMYAKRDGGLHGALALELVDEIRRLRKELEEKRRRKWLFGR